MHSFYKRKHILSWRTMKNLKKKRTSHCGTVICELIRLKRTWIRVCSTSGMSWRLFHLVTGWHMASTSVTFRGGGQEEINRSVSSSCLAEPSLHARISGGTREVTPPSGSVLCYHLLCETIPVGFHVPDLKETLHL